MKHYLKKHLAPLLLVGVVLLIGMSNFHPGSFLTGWDNLQTELNPALGVKRAFFSVWQEFQSFGHVAGMAHAADLSRAIAVAVASIVLPTSSIRYIFHILYLLIGTLGMLRFLTSTFQKNKWIAAVGSLFYLLNFSVIQLFFLPVDPFSIFFASLPWIIWSFIRLFHTSSRNNWLVFALINILATPAFVAQQLFVVYGLLLTCLSIGLLVKHRSSVTVKKLFGAALVIGMLNSFWLLPQLYFIKTDLSVTTTNKINQLSSSDVRYSNIDRGNLSDFISFTGFFDDRTDGNQQPLFADWNSYRSHPAIQIITYVVFAIILLGMIIPSPLQIGFLLSFALVALALLSNTLPFAQINNFIRSSGTINEIFRSPFTKFGIPYALIGTYFFTNGLGFLVKLLQKRSIHIAAYLVPGIFAVLLLIQAFPAFRGNYFSSEMQVKIPQDYNQLFSYMKSVDKTKRVALLPESTFWGWQYNSWGYDGSGFLWYGLEQPVVSRNFDMWSSTSESYMWEMRQALASQDSHNISSVLEKYDISYLLLDTSVKPVTSTTKALQYDKLASLLKETGTISEAKHWGSLTLYSVTNKQIVKQFVSVSRNVPNIGPSITLTNDDTAYQTAGMYLTDEKKPYQSYYPFLDLTTQTDNPTLGWSLTDDGTNFRLSRTIPDALPLASKTGVFQASLYQSGTQINYSIPYTVTKENNLLSVSFPKTFINTFRATAKDVKDCTKPIGSFSASETADGLKIMTRNGATVCLGFANPTLDQSYGYIAQIDSTNTTGQRLYFYSVDSTNDQPYIEDRLTADTNYYIVDTKNHTGLGYTFGLQQKSYQNLPAMNTLRGLSLYLIPYDILESLTLGDDAAPANPVSDFSVTKHGVDRYTVTLPNTDVNKTVILNQEFAPGWHAYLVDNSKIQSILPFLFGKELKSHVKVNNWANGFQISAASNRETVTIQILYLPQYLEYLGFILQFTSIGILVILYARNRQRPDIFEAEIAGTDLLDRRNSL